MFKYYFKRAGNNQTIHISQRTWSILNLDRSVDVDSLTPNECLSYIETVKHSEITEAFSHCRNIKLPSDVKEIAELKFGILFSLELPNKLTKEEFTQKSLEEKIELLSVPKSLYLYYFLSKDDLIQILRFFNKEFSKNSETIELRLLVRSILNRNQSEDDNDSDPDFIPKPFNIEQRSPVITRSKKRDTELVDPNNINNRLETFNMSKPIFFKPEFYSGEPDECVNDFIENYNLISAANEWSDDKKIMYAPIYLKKSAKAFYQNYIISNPTPSWSHFELALKEYFMSPGRARMLKAKLTNRKLKSNETVSQFLADFQLLAHKVNPNMVESEKIDLILEALPPDFYNPVALMNNNTLSDLQNNLRKVESAKATVNERNNFHNFDALKAEIEVLNKKLVEQNALVAHQLSFHNNNQNNYKRYNSNNYNNRHNDERNFEKNYLKNNKFNKNNNNYYQSNTNFPTGQHFNDIINSEQISSCTENVDEVPIPGVRLEVMGHINNIETSFILDSGATISVINSEQVINSSNSLIETKNIRVHTANGSILKVIGKMEIDIAFKNWIFPTQFVLVSNLAGPALLGTDFLSKYRVQLDFFNKEIVIYKNITNKITFTFKPKRDVLSSCTIVEDSVKQNEQSKETHENKIEINIDNNSENDVNLSGQNENIILLEKLAKQINDTDKKFPPFHQIKPKINKLEINNVTLYETKKYIESDKINDTYELLNKSIISLASKFVKLENVPSDGNCGVHALVKILNNEQINVNFKQITDLLKITKYKTPIWLEAEDLAAVINHYNLNLIVIQETLTSDNNSTVLAYYKSGRKCVSVFYNLNHWTPGVLSNEINTAVINSVVIYDFPSLKSRHSVLHSRYKCNDRLGGENIYNISNNADIMHNHYRPIVNSKKLDNISPDIACENFDINPDLTNKQKGDLIQLLNKYKNIFSQSKWDLGEVDTDPIEIKLSDKTPVNLRNFKLSLSEIKEIEKQTKDLLEAGIIEHSTSAYSSPIFLVPKGQPQGTKNKTASEYRMVLDYRRVNEKTLKEAFPLPIIQNIYDSLAGNKYFSCLDAMSGFHQLKLNDNSKEITSFSTSTGHYQFTRLPFGLTNAPQNFQKVMNKIMAGLTYRINCCYLDDCVCFGKTFEEHLNALEITFERLLKYKLKLKISKCKFGYTEIKLLGNIINGQGIKPTEEGLLAIRNFPSPTTIKQLRSFLGLANYFRRFIPNFSKLAHPLTELTKGKFKSKKSIIPWSETQEIAFKNLKLKLTNKPVLSHFNDNAEIILVTDGSKKGLGVILQQINENHEIHPVAYASKKLNTAQNNYSALELEMAALHFGCIHFRQYLHSRTFTVWTDHKNLIQLQTIKSESTILNRLRTKLIGFDFKIIYKKGIFNQAADFLSRYPIENNVITTNLNEHQINIVEPVNLKILQARDNYLKNIITVLENSEIVDIKWKNKAKSYTLNNKNGLIYYKEKINGHPKLVLAIPEILTNEVIQNFHDNKMSGAHLGVHKVYNKIRTRYHWPLMHKQIKAYVTSCIHCQKRKPDKSKQVGKMLTYPIESGIPFSDVTIDYVGPLMPSRGFRYILVATCRVTKYCVAKACRNADAKSTTAFLLDLLLSYGAMKVVRSDNGTHFTAKVISDILTALNIKKTEGIAYRPTSQGGVEKQNQVIIDMIAPYMQNNEKWSDVLQIVLHAYNSAIHYSTGYSPFYLLHGYEPSSIFDIAVIPNSLEHSVIEELNKLQKVRNTIPEILKKAFENQKMNTDKNRSDIDFIVGEQVLVKIPIRKHKFSDRYDGPYPIIKKLNTNSYLIKLPKNGKLVNVPIHVQQIKKFIDKRHPTHSIYYYS
ncbi:hypothetical protein QTP88_017593 [Uroleucon formosanum]